MGDLWLGHTGSANGNQENAIAAIAAIAAAERLRLCLRNAGMAASLPLLHDALRLRALLGEAARVGGAVWEMPEEHARLLDRVDRLMAERAWEGTSAGMLAAPGPFGPRPGEFALLRSAGIPPLEAQPRAGA